MGPVLASNMFRRGSSHMWAHPRLQCSCTFHISNQIDECLKRFFVVGWWWGEKEFFFLFNSSFDKNKTSCRFREHFNKLLFCCRFEETPDQVRIRIRREAGRESLSQSLSSLLVVVFTLLIVRDVSLYRLCNFFENCSKRL